MSSTGKKELNREFLHNSSTNELLLINDFANHCFCMSALNDVLGYFCSGFVLGFAVIVCVYAVGYVLFDDQHRRQAGPLHFASSEE